MPLSYLQPPPSSSPVVVIKDTGGYVDDYAAQTEMYRRTNREVRLHECRSACTMALSLPNVCVYPDSVLKFHQAYDPRNHVTNWPATEALFQTYPDAVRARLGTPTKQYTILRGSELIELGIRNCNGSQPRIMMAKASVKPIPDGMFSGSAGLSGLTGKLKGMIPSFGDKPGGSAATLKPVVPVTTDMLKPDGGRPAEVPLPPERPDMTITADIHPSISDDVVPTLVPFGGVPLPPPRPKVLVAYAPKLAPIPLSTPIAGSQVILPTTFTPFRTWTAKAG